MSTATRRNINPTPRAYRTFHTHTLILISLAQQANRTRIVPTQH